MISKRVHFHMITFCGILTLFYGAIFMRVDYWPLSDWGLFTEPASIERFSYTIQLKTTSYEKRVFLKVSPPLFNKMVVKAIEYKRLDELDIYMGKLIKQSLGESELSEVDCPCFIRIQANRLVVEEDKLRQYREVFREYKL